MDNSLKEVSSNKKGDSIFAVIVVLIIVFLVGCTVYFNFIKEDSSSSNGLTETSGNAGSKDNTSNSGGVIDDSEKLANEVFSVYQTRTSSFLPVIPIYINKNGETITDYNASDLEAIDYSNVIFNYVTAYRDNYCNNDGECSIKISELNNKVGLNINHNFEKSQYIKGIIVKDGIEYYDVYSPAIGFDTYNYVRDCEKNYDNTTKKLNVICEITEEKLEEPLKKLGQGIFTYDLSEKIVFEKFKFEESVTKNAANNEKNNSLESNN